MILKLLCLKFNNYFLSSDIDLEGIDDVDSMDFFFFKVK